MAFWVSDGSNEIQVNESVVTCTAGPGGNTYNAMWKDGCGATKGDHYWKINFSSLGEQGAFVGLSNQEMFAKGWGIKGLFYGGNLSNGGGLLVQEYGPRFKSGDTIGILASMSEGNLKVYFYHNEKPLGLAFDVDSSVLPPGLYPVIHFSDSGSATITQEMALPSSREKSAKSFSGIEGYWKVVPESIILGGNPFQLGDLWNPDVATMTLTPSGGENNFMVSLAVINNVRFQIAKTSSGWECTRPGMSTMMAGPPQLMELENKLSALAENPQSVTSSANELILLSNNDSVKFVRKDEDSKVYTGNPFA